MGGLPHAPSRAGVAAVRARRECGRGATCLGHHSLSFALDAYVHLLPGDAAAPADLNAELVGALEDISDAGGLGVDAVAGRQLDPRG